MVGYKKEERDLIENAKSFFMEHSPKTIIDKEGTDTTEILNFYHDSGLLSTPEMHLPFWSLMKKLEDGYVDAVEEDNKKKAAEKVHLLKLREEADLKAAKRKREEAAEALEEAERIASKGKREREAKLRALEAEKKRIEAQVEAIGEE